MTDFCRSRYNGHPGMNFASTYREQQPQRYPSLPIHVDVTDNPNTIYRFESERLRSFENWPVPFLDPKKVAEAGFYYTQEGDRVRCFECRIQICKWVEGDDPQFEHQRWSDRCRFVRKIPCGNVPIGANPEDIPTPVSRPRDVCGPYETEVRTNPEFNPSAFSPSNLQHLSTATLGSWGLSIPKEPSHPRFASRDARLRTFELWPKSMKQTKEELADAGFFYTGKGDQTLCYHCGGGLKDWEPVDKPWEQHALWFSKCYYLLTVKGQAFVDEVKGLSVQHPSVQDTQNLNLPNYIKKVERPAEDMHVEASPSVASKPCTSSGQGSIANGIRKSIDSAYGSQDSEEKQVDNARLCKICFAEELGVVFLPCGHMVACVKCAPSLTTCAVCREPFTMTVRAIIS